MCTQLKNWFTVALIIAWTYLVLQGCRPLEPRVERHFKSQKSQPSQEGTSNAKEGKSHRDPLDESSTPSLAKRALAVLEAKCESCHNPETAVISAFDYIMYVEKMIDEQQIVPGSVEGSRLYQRIADGTMPPEGSPPISKEERQTLRDWIESGSLISQSIEGDVTEHREFLPRTKSFDVAVEDIRKLPPTERRYIRYLSSANLYNGGYSSRVISYAEAGANKLINTFSAQPSLKRIQSIHRSGTLFRVDLREFGISPEKWRTVEIFYPYHHVTDEFSKLAYLQEQTASSLPIMRIDWFLANAGRPPVYYDMIGTPNMFSKLQENLGIDTMSNIANRQVIRAGFEDSMVAKDHRIIERHSTSDGYLWLSYEFAEPTGNQNIFTHPFGPRGAFTIQQTNRQFEVGGHELFYTRPNGMLAFAIYDFQGRRMHEAPALIRQDGELIEEVIAGRTCHICHGNGPIFKADQVADKVSVILSSFEQNLLRELYVSPEDFRDQIDSDSRSYAAAMALLGIAPGSADPIASISQSFDAGLSVIRAAAELSLSEVGLERYISENEQIRKILSPCELQKDPITYERLCFETNFQRLAQIIWSSEVSE